MRTYGRVYQRDANGVIVPGTKGKWVVVETDAAGDDTMVWLTTLCQNLQLNTNESPFDAQCGIPQQPSIVQQFFPDYWMWLIQRQFSANFANIIISREDSPTPTYRVNVTTNQGFKLSASVPIAA